MNIEDLKDFSINIDEDTLMQIKSCITYDFVVDAALMPDAHSGYVAPIGSVILTKDFVVPAWVGYDIGCGVLAVKLISKNLLSKIKKNREIIFANINSVIPMGKGSYNDITNITRKSKKKYIKLLEEFKGKLNKADFNFFKQKSVLLNLGSLGSGNHFIELGFSSFYNKSDEVWIIVHTGSRNVGHYIAEKYMNLAKKLNLLGFDNKKDSKSGIERTYPLKYFSEEGKFYLAAHNFCLNFAKLNRLEIVYKIHEMLEKFFHIKIDIEIWSNSSHNHLFEIKDFSILDRSYLKIEGIKSSKNKLFIHRKGATSAKRGEKNVIPGNMKEGSYLVVGLGNKDYLYSSSHGAGRVLSRKEAKKRLSLEKFKEVMKGIVGNIDERTIDESPFVYKNILEVLDMQNKSIEVVDHIVPLINWKG